MDELRKMIAAKDAYIAWLETKCITAEQNYFIISYSFFWKITGPARLLLAGVKMAAKQDDSLYLFLKTIKKKIRSGPGKAGLIWKEYLGIISRIKSIFNWPSKEVLTEHRNTKFERQVKISILVLLYNTPSDYLKEMIMSVQAQSYQVWELCLADGSEAEHEEVGIICNEFAINDKRIKYQKLERNLGISKNSNTCIEMAEVDYIALLDHDALLHPSALYEVIKIICEKGVDFIYTDETTFVLPDRD